MCFTMANIIQSQEMIMVPQNLRKQLAVAVRSIQWSYAIFWSLSSTQQGVLEWVDGYYNGDIKTRKTIQEGELRPDKIGLQRSEQLRELYMSLLDGEIDQQQGRRSSAILSPEDLTDAEWYYLVCMSFVFNPGQGLPGRALAYRQTTWLCNAQYTDSKVFSRSLLAKSASIQTVVCFPHLDGVIEIGVTELVAEDPSLIQHVKASLLDISKPVCSEKSSSDPHNGDDDINPMFVKVVHEIVNPLAMESLCTPAEDIKLDQEGINENHGNMDEELNMDPPDDGSNGCEHNHQTEDSFMLEGFNGDNSQVQSRHFMDDEFSNGAQDSINSSDCISEAFANQEKALTFHKGKNVNCLQLKTLQEGNDTKLSSLDLGDDDDDLHYRRTLSFLLKGSNLSIEDSCFYNGHYKSSFITWKKGVVYCCRPEAQQNLLKKILFAVPLMHGNPSVSPLPGGKDEIGTGHILSDKPRENEKFMVLKSMIPCINEISKESIFNSTNKYLKELEARVEELESSIASVDHKARPRMNYLDMVEQTSDNHDDKKIENSRKPCANKRKACDIDESNPELNEIISKDGLPLDIKVCMKEKEVLIQMRCPYREYILLDIMDEINNLLLDVCSIQSSNVDGILLLNLKSKFRGEAVTPAGMIKQVLCKISGRT